MQARKKPSGMGHSGHMPLFCGNGPLCSMTESLCLCSMDGEGRRPSARRLLAVRGLPSRPSRRMRFGATGCRRAVRLGAVRRACQLPFAMARPVRALAHAATASCLRPVPSRSQLAARRPPPAAARRLPPRVDSRLPDIAGGAEGPRDRTKGVSHDEKLEGRVVPSRVPRAGRHRRRRRWRWFGRLRSCDERGQRREDIGRGCVRHRIGRGPLRVGGRA